MIQWVPYAFVRIVLFFITGICLGIYYPDIISNKYVYIIFSLLVLLYWGAAFFIRQRKLLNDQGQQKFNVGFIGLIAVFIGGYLHTHLQTETNYADHIIKDKGSIEYYKAVLINSPSERKNSFKAEATIESVLIGSEWKSHQGKIVLYFSKQDFSSPFHYGDVFLIKGTPQLISAPLNPDEFDYKRYLSFKDIYHQQFIKKENIRLIDYRPSNSFVKYASLSRSWAESQLKKYVAGTRERGIIIALVLGVTDGLDNELLSAYGATGAMHVLSVSGLHVGIIYGLLLFLLNPINKTRTGKWTLAIISICLLWMYAFITGLSPSVLRAVTMFSFVALSRPVDYRTNIYNTLAASAFVILLYDPYLIMSVGFQLSYLALLGIVSLYNGLSNLIQPNTLLMSKVWKMTAMSIAAQVATFALGLFYFHQFPNYFILSNLLVIPGSSLILFLGLTLLATSFFSSLASLLSNVIAVLIKLMNVFVFWIESLPFSLINNIYISSFQCWLLMAITISLLLLIKYKRLSYLYGAAVLSLIYTTFQWIHFNTNVNHKQLAVYSIKGHSAIDLMEKGHSYFIADSAMYTDLENIQFHIQPNRLRHGVSHVIDGRVSMIKNVTGANAMYWNGKLILLVNDKNCDIPTNAAVDFLVIANNSVKDIRKIRKLNFKKVILDGSNSLYFANQFLKEAKAQNMEVHSVLHAGAFTTEL